MKNTLNLCLLLLLSLLLWSCDDGSQTYTRLRVESEYFDVAKIAPGNAADTLSKHNVEQKACDFGYVAKYGDVATVYRLKKGTEFTIYEDKDWDWRDGQPTNLFIIGGKVLDESVEVPWNAQNYIAEGLSLVTQGDITKEKSGMSLSEYQAHLREVCPPKAQARSMFMWVGIGLIVSFLLVCGGVAFKDSDEDSPENDKSKWSKNRKIAFWIYATVALSMFLAVPVAVYLYFYLNPNESMWFITDWGFLGFFAGLFILFAILAIAISPLFMVGECFRKIFSRDWWKGLLMLAVVAGLCVVSYFFLKMVLIQIWEQCGFIIRSVGVLILLFLAPTGLASGFSSGGNNGTPDVVSDGNGNYHYVAGSQTSGTIQTTDGRTMRRHADGNYRDVHNE